jgi:uncharacterized protein YcgI (DUF1989 family)
MNFFSRVHAGADGALEYAVGHSKPGAYVELRAEMDTLVVLNTAPHPLNPAREYAPGPVELNVRRAEPVGENDYCVGFRPENGRAYANTAIYNCQLGDEGSLV